MLKAITRSARLVDSRVEEINRSRSSLNPPKLPITIAQFFDHHADPSDMKVEVEQEDFLSAQRELVPSVSEEELNHYDRVRRDFEGNDTRPQAQPVQPAQSVAPRSLQPPSMDASAEEIERWQAAQIEAIMARGFADGSLARNDPKGKGKGKAPIGFGDSGRFDDVVAGTESMHLNGNGSYGDQGPQTSSSGKGKGKERAANGDGNGDGFGNAAQDDDLY